MPSPDPPENHQKKNGAAVTALVNGHRLQALRQQVALTQEQLAEKVG